MCYKHFNKAFTERKRLMYPSQKDMWIMNTKPFRRPGENTNDTNFHWLVRDKANKKNWFSSFFSLLFFSLSDVVMISSLWYLLVCIEVKIVVKQFVNILYVYHVLNMKNLSNFRIRDKVFKAVFYVIFPSLHSYSCTSYAITQCMWSAENYCCYFVWTINVPQIQSIHPYEYY